MSVSTELRNYLAIFIRATPDPRYDPEIWSEMSAIRRCGRGMAVRDPKPTMSNREINDIVAYLATTTVVPAMTSRGDLRNALTNGFEEWSARKAAT